MIHRKGRDTCGGRVGILVVSLAILAGCKPSAETASPTDKRASLEHLVELALAERGSLRTTSVYTGSLRHRRTVRIFSQEEGRIASLPYFEGDTVATGHVIMELDDRLLRADVDKAAANLRASEIVVRRYERLRSQKLVSEDEYLKAETEMTVNRADLGALETRLGYTRVEAPFDAVVSARLAEPGDIVSRHSHVLTLVDPASLVLDTAVSELVMPLLAVGDTVSVRIDALGDRRFPGRLTRIHPELDATTRQGRVEVTLDPVPDGARAGQFARVTFEIDSLERVIVPFQALRRDRAGEFVFTVTDEGRARRAEVRSGQRNASRVEILDGLASGDRVVIRGFLGLTEGLAVTPVSTDNSLDASTVGTRVLEGGDG